ncbi:MAG: restriction endonuclease subunit S, partial [Bacilli bacterium]|nr:restriction endonuclease subunit S [Bacilli bacterium]
VPNLRFPEFTEVWKDSNIGKCFDLYSGNTPSRMEKKHFIGDVNWITSGELKEHYIGDTKERISEKAAEDNNLRILPVGTFVMAIYGLEAEGVRGTCSITVKTSTISQACMAFTPKSNVSNEFLYSWYKKHGNKIGIRYAQGTKQQNLSYDIIEKFPIRYPSIEEQEKLNTFISLLDKRIATQNKIIEDLKKLKVAIIEKVFSEKKCNYKIGDVISQVSIRNKSKKETNILSVSNKWGFVEQSEQFEDRIVASEDITNYKVVRTNDFAYNPARINVGSIARLKRYESGIVSPMYICFHSQNALLPEYLELFFYTLYFKHEMYKRLEGSVRLCLSFEGLTNIPIFIPEITTQREISIKVNSIETKIGIEETYLNALKDQKQYLLKHMFI